MEVKKPVEDSKNKRGKNEKEEELEKADQFNIITEFNIKMGNNEISECYIYEQFGFCCVKIIIYTLLIQN